MLQECGSSQLLANYSGNHPSRIVVTTTAFSILRKDGESQCAEILDSSAYCEQLRRSSCEANPGTPGTGAKAGKVKF